MHLRNLQLQHLLLRQQHLRLFKLWRECKCTRNCSQQHPCISSNFSAQCWPRLAIQPQQWGNSCQHCRRRKRRHRQTLQQVLIRLLHRSTLFSNQLEQRVLRISKLGEAFLHQHIFHLLCIHPGCDFIQHTLGRHFIDMTGV
jgi:hypothetical protein